MRADRLVAALLLLQARGTVTAADLAAALETSVSTARRDLDALSGAGIPVYPQRGRGGGWQLLGGARTDLSGLTAPEVAALFRLVGPAAAVSPDARAALRKLVRALPEPFRADADRAARSVTPDPVRWGADAEPPPAALPTVEAALATGRAVAFRYRGAGTGAATATREASPWGLVDKAGRWYLVAGTPGGRRTFRLDRMAGVTVLDRPAEVPEGVDVGREWSAVVAHAEARRGAVAARVRVPAGLLGPLRATLGARHVRTEAGSGTESGSDGRAVVVTVTADTTAMLARQLAGWVPDVEVLGPPAVRSALVERGRAIVAACGGEPGPPSAAPT